MANKAKFLCAFDFDFTVIDDDSDHWVFDKLSPQVLGPKVRADLEYACHELTFTYR
jgi:hypothetical protein